MPVSKCAVSQMLEEKERLCFQKGSLLLLAADAVCLHSDTSCWCDVQCLHSLPLLISSCCYLCHSGRRWCVRQGREVQSCDGSTQDCPVCLPHSCIEAHLCPQLCRLELLVLVGITAMLAVIHRSHSELAGSL